MGSWKEERKKYKEKFLAKKNSFEEKNSLLSTITCGVVITVLILIAVSSRHSHPWHHDDWISTLGIIVTGFFACMTWRVSKSGNLLAEGQKESESQRFHVDLYRDLASQLNAEYQKMTDGFLFRPSSTMYMLSDVRAFYKHVYVSLLGLENLTNNEIKSHVLKWFWFFLSDEIHHEVLSGEKFSNLYKSHVAELNEIGERKKADDFQLKFENSGYLYFKTIRNEFSPIASDIFDYEVPDSMFDDTSLGIY